MKRRIICSYIVTVLIGSSSGIPVNASTLISPVSMRPVVIPLTLRNQFMSPFFLDEDAITATTKCTVLNTNPEYDPYIDLECCPPPGDPGECQYSEHRHAFKTQMPDPPPISVTSCTSPYTYDPLTGITVYGPPSCNTVTM